MDPFLATYYGELVLVLAFVREHEDSDGVSAIVVREGGRLSELRATDLIVERSTGSWPAGYGNFSRVAMMAASK